MSKAAQVDPIVTDAWAEHGDAMLVCTTSRLLATPREGESDSFVLHAPLELAARAGLLPWVWPEHKEAARGQILSLARRYRRWGPAAPAAVGLVPSFRTARDGAGALAAAIDKGDLESVDVITRGLASTATPQAMCDALAPVVIQHLGAAAHAPIFLYLYPRVSPRGELSAELLRPLLRQLARDGDQTLHWVKYSNLRSSEPASTKAYWQALVDIPNIGPHESGLIYPTMARVDVRGENIAAPLLGQVCGGTDTHDRGRALLRAAAWSMLLEPDTHAAYGWTHALTMTQAAIGISAALSDPGLGLAVASTYLVGFRAARATVPLPASAGAIYRPRGGARLVLKEALQDSREAAAAAAYFEAVHDPEFVMSQLAGQASALEDAHLVKYVLACFDAARDDRIHQALFLAAAASLVAYWNARLS